MNETGRQGTDMTDQEFEQILWTHTASEEAYLKNIKKELHLETREEIREHMDWLREKKINRFFTTGRMHFSGRVYFKRHSRFNHVMPHCHKYIEMQYIYSGEFHQSVNGETMVLKKGDVCILDPHTIHDNQLAGEYDIILVFAMNTDVFNNTFFESLEINNAISHFLIRCLYEERKNKAYMFFETAEHPQVRNIFRELSKELTEPGIGSDTIIESCLLILFTCLLRIYGDKNHTMQKIDEDYKERASLIRYIKSHYLDISLEKMAGEFGFHPNYFCKYIKKITGYGFKDLVAEERLKQAGTLLLETGLSAEEVAASCGFSNQNTFYRKFKEKYRCTPKEFRNQRI